VADIISVMDAAAPVRDWLDDVWRRTAAVQIVRGGEGGGPVDGRAVIAEIRGAREAGELRALATAGRFTGDVCRCRGGPTIVLRDEAGRVTGSGSIHGFGSVSWDRRRFGNDLRVDDPTGLHLFLARHGVAGQMAFFLAPLTEYLGLAEGEPQFRPGGAAGLSYLAARRVPEVLHPVLSGLTGQEVGALSPVPAEDLDRILTAAIPAPVDRAVALLSWLGRLPVPAEALWGEGVLARRLLAGLSRTDLVTAAATDSAHVAMGVINVVMHGEDDARLAEAVSPVLRRVLPLR
jgi:hypothetical protein